MRAEEPLPTTGAIDEFTWREGREWVHSFLSNFFIEEDGTCVEIEFQAAKTHNPFVKRWVLASRTPGEAKRRGRSKLMKSVMRPDWDSVRVDVMLELVRKKFRDHPGLAELLIATGAAKLVEGNTWHDQFWGDCTCYEQKHFYRRGQNHLGRILMRVREELKQ